MSWFHVLSSRELDAIFFSMCVDVEVGTATDSIAIISSRAFYSDCASSFSCMFFHLTVCSVFSHFGRLDHFFHNESSN